jgi:hypothetical protein
MPPVSKCIMKHTKREMSDADNCYAPFCSKIDWEIAQWAKTHGPSSTAVTELLAIDKVRFSHSFSILHLPILCQLSEKLSLSYKNAQELNSIFMHKLPCQPPFQSHHIEIADDCLHPGHHLMHKGSLW